MPLPKILYAGDPRAAGLTSEVSRAGSSPLLVGWREWVGLPQLGLAGIMAKIDTGARTSALHANSIEIFERTQETWVRFDVTGEGEQVPWHEMKLAGQRMVRSSNGISELRCVIATELRLGGRRWPIEVTLTNREKMELPMLIGREALAGRVIVDAAKSWQCGKPGQSRRASTSGAGKRARKAGAEQP